MPRGLVSANFENASRILAFDFVRVFGDDALTLLRPKRRTHDLEALGDDALVTGIVRRLASMHQSPARGQRSRSKHFFEPKNGGLAFFACHLVNPSRVPDTIAKLCQLSELSDQRLLI